jgi:hypothetical protein
MVMATDKSFYNRKIKVSQSTIDDIKKMGMTAALKGTNSNKSAEYKEGIKRMYGERRYAAAMGASGTKSKVTDSRFTGLGAGKPKPSDSRFTGLGAGKPKPSTSAKPKSSSSNNTKSNILKGISALAVGGLLLAATKNPAAAARAGSLAMKGKNIVPAAKKAGPIAGKISRKGPGTQMEFAKKAAEDKMRQNITKRAGGIVTKKYNALGKEVGADLGFKPQSLQKAQPQLKTFSKKQAFMKNTLGGKSIVKKAPVKSVPKKKTPSITKKKIGIAGGVAGTSASNKQMKRK